MPTYFAVYNQGGTVNQIDYVEIEFSCAEESTPFNNNYLKYTYSSDKGGYVCSVNPDSYYPCMKGDINIPSSYNDGVNGSYPVVEIANETFMKNNAPNVTGVYFPNSIKKYGDYLFRFNTSLTNVQLSTGAANIAPYMFDGCTNLQAIDIPNTVTSISDYAFNECRSITNLVIPNSVTQISNTGTFTSMSGLKSITWPSGITQIGPCYGGSGLETLTIPDSVTTIKYSAFVGSTLLETLTLGQNVTSIEWNAFDGCTSLQSINFNDDLQLIYQYAFSSCSSLEELVLPNSLTTIGHHAFYQCSSLTSVVIPVSVVDINDNVFNKCTNLSYVEYEGTSSQWRSIQFHGFTNQFDNTGVTVVHCSDGDITPFPTE